MASVPSIGPTVSLVDERRNTLEQEIAVLKAEKSSYLVSDYYAELQRLLLELVVVEIQIEDAAERNDP